MGKLVCGVGINDADYSVLTKERTEDRLPSGNWKMKTVFRCPYHTKWGSMLERCYSPIYHEQFPTYKDCIVCEDWLTFSNFRKWMEGRVWKGLHLDKDFLIKDNKVYSPETCVFIESKINTFLNKPKRYTNTTLIGTHLRDSGNFRSKCSNPFLRGDGSDSTHNTELEAHLAWKKQKHLYACQLAESEYVTDERVRQVLLHRYENYTIVEEHLK